MGVRVKKSSRSRRWRELSPIGQVQRETLVSLKDLLISGRANAPAASPAPRSDGPKAAKAPGQSRALEKCCRSGKKAGIWKAELLRGILHPTLLSAPLLAPTASVGGHPG